MTWYRLTKDVELTYNFYGRCPDSETISYKKGSYVEGLEKKLYSEQADYTITEQIPEDAVEKFECNPYPTIYYGEDGNEYYAEWGEWKEDLQKYEFEDDPIKTGDRVYFE